MNHFSIRVDHLFKRFGRHTVFRDISFLHKKGGVGIAGPNGSGKSTLLKCMAGLSSPSKGKVEWFKNDRSIGINEFKRNLGYAATYINLYNELSCGENLNFLLKLRNYNGRTERVRSVLEHTAMNTFSDQPFGSLSTGQQQRMRLAAALAPQPDVLFLDEPGSNMDEPGHKLIQGIVHDFKVAGKLIVIASNNQNELDLCDSIYSVEEEAFQDA